MYSCTQVHIIVFSIYIFIAKSSYFLGKHDSSQRVFFFFLVLILLFFIQCLENVKIALIFWGKLLIIV